MDSFAEVWTVLAARYIRLAHYKLALDYSWEIEVVQNFVLSDLWARARER